MKFFLPQFFLLIFCNQKIAAQPCATGNAKTEIYANNIRATINQGGKFFSNGNSPGFFPTTKSGANNIGTVFSAGLWLGGVDLGGNLKISATTYKAGFFAGNLDFQGTTNASNCSNWNKIFTAKSDQIAGFLSALQLGPQPVATDFPEIFGWPGTGNPHFSALAGFDLPANNSLAPFFDKNGDAKYDPLDGDFPVVQLKGKKPFVPAEIAWCVFNDDGAGAKSPIDALPTKSEVQMTVWAFNCDDQKVLQNSVFVSHKIINRAAVPLDSVSVGIWMDYDLGCGGDDLIGCNPSKNFVFAYNQDITDGDSSDKCAGGVPTFGKRPPTQTTIFLDKNLDKFVSFGNRDFQDSPVAMLDPLEPAHFFHFLNGRWNSGKLLTFGGVGYSLDSSAIPTTHLFPDDPADPNAWSLCAIHAPFCDRRNMASDFVGKLRPGEDHELNTAWATHFQETDYLGCDLGNTIAEVDIIQSAFDENFAKMCSEVPVSDKNRPDFENKISLLPNPASQSFQIFSNGISILETRIFGLDGRLVLEDLKPIFGKKEVPVLAWPSGIYIIQIATEQGVFSKKLIVNR